MGCGIGIGGIAVKALADHQHPLLVGIACCGWEGNLGRQRHIAGDFFPDVMKRVGCSPDVLTAGGNAVGLLGGVIFHRPGMQHGADIAVAFENPRLGEQCRRRQQSGHRDPHVIPPRRPKI
jgi:hypothetical protein